MKDAAGNIWWIATHKGGSYVAEGMHSVTPFPHAQGTPRFNGAAVLLLILGGCAAPPRVEQPKPDPTREAAYANAVEQLATLNREAADLLKKGNADEAAANITKGQPLQTQLLAAPQPTLAAMEAVADLDELYARMLLSNHHDGWARMLFQKNVVRWKAWTPQTPDTARRLRQAKEWVAECDRSLGR